MNEQFREVVESPLVLVLDPLKAVPTAKRLPVDLYEAELRMSDTGKPRSVFAHLKFKIETGESERIAVDHIARVRPVTEGDRQWFWVLFFFSFVICCKVFWPRIWKEFRTPFRCLIFA